MTTKKHPLADVLIAIAEGKTVEVRSKLFTNTNWQTIQVSTDGTLIIDTNLAEYRVKPKEVVDYALVFDNGVVASQFYPSTHNICSFIGDRHYKFRQGFVKRTRIDGKVISFEYISK